MGNWDVSKQNNDGEPCEDAINRREAIDRWNQLSVRGRTEFDQVLMTMPSVTPKQEPCGDTVSLGVFEQVMWERDVAIEQLKELGYGFGEKPRTGHWIECEDEVKCFCSECKEISDYPTKFCPNCGAKMVDPQERSEE